MCRAGMEKFGFGGRQGLAQTGRWKRGPDYTCPKFQQNQTPCITLRVESLSGAAAPVPQLLRTGISKYFSG